MERVMNWQGLDFMTQDSDVNPLIASYIGAPYQIRGTDPAGFGRATLDYWQQNSANPIGNATAAVTGPLTSAAAGVAADSGASLWDKVKSGLFGGVLGIVVVALGLALIIWGRD